VATVKQPIAIEDEESERIMHGAPVLEAVK